MLKQVGGGIYAYIQPLGTWGWNNAGIICDSEEALLVDTLFDLKLTQKMLDAMGTVCDIQNHLKTVVNTHANGDHYYGNQLVEHAEIIASVNGAAQMNKVPAALMCKLMKLAHLGDKLGLLRRPLGGLACVLGKDLVGAVLKASPYLVEIFKPFDFENINCVLPSKTFDGKMSLNVGSKRVELIDTGSAHTHGDVMVFVPDEKVLFAGDLLFIGGHPIAWHGPISNWIEVLESILEMDVETIVPGHGPLTDKEGVKIVITYFEYLKKQCKERFHAGMTATQAAYDIDMSPYSDWTDGERIVVNVDSIYRELSSQAPAESIVPFFPEMARYRARVNG